jgi:hypothetical protein
MILEAIEATTCPETKAKLELLLVKTQAKEAKAREKANDKTEKKRAKAIEKALKAEAKVKEKALKAEAKAKEKALKAEAIVKEKALKDEAKAKEKALKDEAIAKEKALKAEAERAKLAESFKIINELSEAQDRKIGFDWPHIISKVKELPQGSFSYSDWLGLGMSLHKLNNASIEGLNIWIEMSYGNNYTLGDEEYCAKKWESFSTERETGGVFGATNVMETLARLGIEGGDIVDLAHAKTEPIGNLEFIKAIIDSDLSKATITKDSKAVPALNAFTVIEQESKESWPENFTPAYAIAFMNNMGFALLLNPSGVIIRLESQKVLVNVNGKICSRTIIEELERHTPKSLAQTYLKAHKVLVPHEKKGMMEIPLSEYWLSSPKANYYEKVHNSPIPKKGVLSTFKTSVDILFSCMEHEHHKYDLDYTQLKLVDISPLTDFIETYICRKDASKINVLYDWLGALFLYPEVKDPTIIVVVGDQGTGKNLIFADFLSCILGDMYRSTDIQRTQDKFNSQLSGARLVLFDEVTKASKDSTYDHLKALTGNSLIQIEHKGVDKIVEELYVARHVILTNHAKILNIPSDDRRIIEFNVDPSSKDVPDFFSKLAPFILETPCVVWSFYNFIVNRFITKHSLLEKTDKVVCVRGLINGFVSSIFVGDDNSYDADNVFNLLHTPNIPYNTKVLLEIFNRCYVEKLPLYIKSGEHVFLNLKLIHQYVNDVRMEKRKTRASLSEVANMLDKLLGYTPTAVRFLYRHCGLSTEYLATHYVRRNGHELYLIKGQETFAREICKTLRYKKGTTNDVVRAFTNSALLGPSIG